MIGYIEPPPLSEEFLALLGYQQWLIARTCAVPAEVFSRQDASHFTSPATLLWRDRRRSNTETAWNISAGR